MARAIQLEKPEETEVAAVSADIDPNTDYDDYDGEMVSGVTPDETTYAISGISYSSFTAEYSYSPFGNHGRKEKDPEKTYLQQLTGKRIIILD